MERSERESMDHIKVIGPVISEAFRLGKDKQYDKAYHVLEPYFQKDEVPEYFCQPAGWTIYRYIKENMQRIPSSQATKIFGYYLNFCAHKPDLLHSLMMVLAIAYKNQHRQELFFSAFCQRWGLENFREEDFKSEKGQLDNGKPLTFQSLAVKTAACLYKELKVNYASENISAYIPFFLMIKEKCPEYEFTSLYNANLYAWMGDKDKSVSMFKDMLVHQQQWYLWKSLGDLLDKDLKLSCYCKALSMMNKEEYILEIRYSLADMLCQENKPQAVYELNRYMSTCQQKEWRVKAHAYELLKLLSGVAPVANPKEFYDLHIKDAEDFVFAEYPSDEFVFTNRFVNKKGKNVAKLLCQKKHIQLNVPLSTLPSHAGEGDVFLCHYLQEDKRSMLLTIHKTDKHIQLKKAPSTSAEQQKEITGNVTRREDQPFAFLNKKYFISPSLCNKYHISDGIHISAKVIQQPDGRWRVTKIKSL